VLGFGELVLLVVVVEELVVKVVVTVEAGAVV
jgi:hypothetical protein